MYIHVYNNTYAQQQQQQQRKANSHGLLIGRVGQLVLVSRHVAAPQQVPAQALPGVCRRKRRTKKEKEMMQEGKHRTFVSS